MVDATCSVEGCARKVQYAGLRLCGGCYQARRRLTAPPCSVDGCERPSRALGMCQMHYRRLRKDGSVGQVEPLINVGARQWVNGVGYVVLCRPGHPMADGRGNVYEHRLVAYEAGLLTGREDRRIVHHKNHDKLDNRPENLEVLTPEAHRSEHRKVDYGEAVRRRAAGESCRSIAASFGVDPATIYRLLKQLREQA